MSRAALFSVAAFLAVWLLGVFHARAQDAPPPEIADQVKLCSTCHGAEGRPVVEDTPIIWGQEQYYLYVQMRDFQAGRRASAIMDGIVADLSKDQMKALAKYFSQKTWPNMSFKAQEGDAAVANRMATAGQCTQCHLGAYVGNSRVPRSAGQNARYLEKTMLDLKYKRRMNAADMASLMEAFPDEDIAAMARYLASLQPH